MDTDLIKRRLFPIGILSAAASASLYCLEYQVTEQVVSILNTLARVQAAIFAIVFSVIILGVQLSASRYSPRLASEFHKDSGYRWTVGVFAASIGFSIIAVFAVPLFSESTIVILPVVGIGLGILSFWTLWDFVNDTLEKTTPEGILRTIDANLTPTAIVDQAHESANDSLQRDPFLTLVSVIRSILEEGDRVVATQGLSIIEDRVANLFEETPNEEFEEGEPVDESVEHLFTSQVPTLLEESLDEGLTEIAIKVTDVVENIGDSSIDEQLERPHEHLLRGHIELIDQVENERVRDKVIDVSRSLLKSGVKNGLYLSSALGTRLLGWIAAASVMKRDATQKYDGRYTSLLINGFPKILSNAIDSDASLTEYQNTAWLERSMNDVAPIDLITWGCYDSMAELSSAAIRFEMKTGQTLLNWTHVDSGWVSGLSKLRETELETLPQVWLGTILYIEYLSDITDEEVLKNFNTRAALEVEYDFVVTTIQNVLDGLDVTSRIDFPPGGTNPLEFPRTGAKSPPIRDEENTFREWLKQKKEVYELMSETEITPAMGLETDSNEGNDENES